MVAKDCPLVFRHNNIAFLVGSLACQFLPCSQSSNRKAKGSILLPMWCHEWGSLKYAYICTVGLNSCLNVLHKTHVSIKITRISAKLKKKKEAYSHRVWKKMASHRHHGAIKLSIKLKTYERLVSGRAEDEDDFLWTTADIAPVALHFPSAIISRPPALYSCFAYNEGVPQTLPHSSVDSSIWHDQLSRLELQTRLVLYYNAITSKPFSSTTVLHRW